MLAPTLPLLACEPGDIPALGMSAWNCKYKNAEAASFDIARFVMLSA